MAILLQFSHAAENISELTIIVDAQGQLKKEEAEGEFKKRREDELIKRAKMQEQQQKIELLEE